MKQGHSLFPQHFQYCTGSAIGSIDKRKRTKGVQQGKESEYCLFADDMILYVLGILLL